MSLKTHRIQTPCAWYGFFGAADWQELSLPAGLGAGLVQLLLRLHRRHQLRALGFQLLPGGSAAGGVLRSPLGPSEVQVQTAPGAQSGFDFFREPQLNSTTGANPPIQTKQLGLPDAWCLFLVTDILASVDLPFWGFSFGFDPRDFGFFGFALVFCVLILVSLKKEHIKRYVQGFCLIEGPPWSDSFGFSEKIIWVPISTSCNIHSLLFSLKALGDTKREREKERERVCERDRSSAQGGAPPSLEQPDLLYLSLSLSLLYLFSISSLDQSGSKG